MALPDTKTSSPESKNQTPGTASYTLAPEFKPEAEAITKIPQYGLAEVIAPKIKAKTRKEITAENAKAIELWLNNLKPKFYEYMAQTERQAATSANLFTRHLFNYLTLYRGELAGHYLSEGAWEMIFSALGPIGNMMRYAYFKDYQWKMKWMAHPLNPNAIYYYLHALPARKAFEVILLPGKAVFGILAQGGAPFFKKAAYYDYSEQRVKEKYFFSPLLKATQASHILADGLDKFVGTIQNPELINKQLSSVLSLLDEAAGKDEKKGVRKEINLLLNDWDGYFRFATDKQGNLIPISYLPFSQRAIYGAAGVGRAILKKTLGNTARRLRQTERDPISFFLALVGGALWDFSVGFALNILRVATTKIVSLVPGVNVLRARTLQFFTSNRWLNTARIGGITSQNFFKGIFSPTTFSSGYLGYSLFPNSAVGRAIFTPTFAGFGAFYNMSLKMASNPELIKWFNSYNELLLKATDPALSIHQQNFYRESLSKNFLGVDRKFLQFRPGPITRLAAWLNRNWWARIPINGFALRSILLRILPADILANKFLGLPVSFWVNSLPVFDYLWQIKGPLFEKFTQKWARQTWNIFGRKFFTPHWRIFSLQNPESFNFRLRSFFGKWMYEPSFGTDVLVQRPWVRPFRGFTQNFFNPGFFMGFGLSQLLIGLGWNPVAAYIVGPLAGTLTWNLAAFGLEKTFGTSIASMAKINAWGWTGYIIGSVLQLIFPGLPFWFNIATALIFPALGMIFSIPSVSAFFTSIGVRILSGIPALASAAGIASTAMAAWATAMSLLSIASLTVLSVFVIYSAFWVPMMAEWRAGSTSSHFSINTDVSPLGANNYRVCAEFNVIQPIFNGIKYLELQMNFEETDLTVDLTTSAEAAANTEASRNTTALNFLQDFFYLTPNNYSLAPFGEIIGGPINIVLHAYLSTPANETGEFQYGNLYDLSQQNPSVSQIFVSFLKTLQKVAEDQQNDTNYYLNELEQTRNMINLQDDYLKKARGNIAASAKSNDLSFITNQLSQASQAYNNALKNNPVIKPEDIVCAEADSRCLNYKNYVIRALYESWSQFFNQQINKIDNLTQINNLENLKPSLADYLNQLDELISSLGEQWEMLKLLIDKIKKTRLDPDTATYLLSLNVDNYNNLDQADKEKLWEILKKYFANVFDNKQYYYIPQSTNYRFCADTVYCDEELIDCDPSSPPKPQTVCSAIYFQQTPWFWSGASWAKKCVSFTPQ